MLKIGEFSKLSQLTVKALRFYEKEGLLIPSSVDDKTGYRFYTTDQLNDASLIKSYRQLGLTIEEIKEILNGFDKRQILASKIKQLSDQRQNIDLRLSIIKHILEDEQMKYQVTEKVIPECIVYYADLVIDNYSDMMSKIPEIGMEVGSLNPDLKCLVPDYCFCEYLDGEYKESDIHLRYNQAVDKMGKESDLIKFKKLEEVKVLSIFHKGSYDTLGEAYSFILKYIEDNGYKINGPFRESYIDGIWNKETPDEWLSEIQIPIE